MAPEDKAHDQLIVHELSADQCSRFQPAILFKCFDVSQLGSFQRSTETVPSRWLWPETREPWVVP
jgi:hypothetical protein